MSRAKLITEAARLVAQLGSRMIIGLGVDDALTDLVSSLPGAETRVEVFLDEGRPAYVIRSAKATIDGVLVQAQALSRPATAEETAVAKGPDARTRAAEYRTATIVGAK